MRQHEDSRGADELQEAANVAIHDVASQCRGGPINHDAVACRRAEVGSSCRVVVGGVSPATLMFRLAVAHKLSRAGWPNVVVETEW